MSELRQPPTPHIEAKQNAFAKTVILPGDPLRAKYIAETYLKNFKQVTAVRNILGFTGEYQGKPISIMSSGMGIPSISIYAYELFTSYGVENIIRAGSIGGIQDHIAMNDIIIGMGASTDSKVNRSRFLDNDFAAIADFKLLESAVYTARNLQLKPHIGNIMTVDLFYESRSLDIYRQYQAMGILGLEMETAGLYGVAAELGKRALSVFTVSDLIFSGASLSSQEREIGFQDMATLCLQTAISFE